MKKYLLVFFSFFCLNLALSQNDVVLSYTVQADKTQHIPVILRGPSNDCPTVPLMLEATYDPQQDIITVTVRSRYERPLKKKDQLTHLWCPSSLSGTPFNEQMLATHFKQYYRSKLSMTTDMKSQLKDGFAPKTAFECVNGWLLNQKDADVMMNLAPDKVIVLKIKITNASVPVILKINNVIPIKAKYDFPQFFNKVSLQYISNNFSISLRLPSSNCFGQHEMVSKYREWNEILTSDYQQLLDFKIAKKDPSGTSKEVVAKKMELLNKFEVARKGIIETDCEDLAQEFQTFFRYYDKIGEGIVTADSFQRMITRMDALIDDISIARNSGNGKACRKYKESAAVFNAVEFDEALYKDFPELKSLAKRFLERRQILNSLKCPGGGGRRDDSGGGGRCNIDTEKIKASTMRINNLLNEYRLKKIKNEQVFYNIVKETDAYLNDFPDACKSNSKNQTVIQQYQDAKKAYQNAVK